MEAEIRRQKATVDQLKGGFNIWGNQKLEPVGRYVALFPLLNVVDNSLLGVVGPLHGAGAPLH